MPCRVGMTMNLKMREQKWRREHSGLYDCVDHGGEDGPEHTT